MHACMQVAKLVKGLEKTRMDLGKAQKGLEAARRSLEG